MVAKSIAKHLLFIHNPTDYLLASYKDRFTSATIK